MQRSLALIKPDSPLINYPGGLMRAAMMLAVMGMLLRRMLMPVTVMILRRMMMLAVMGMLLRRMLVILS